MKKLIALILLTLMTVSMFASCDVRRDGDPTTPTEPPQPPQNEVDAYAENNGFNNNYICGIDQFGRVFMPTTGRNKEKDVGMFYFLWHGSSSKTTHNITEQLANNPSTLWNKTANVNQYHYWGEPLFGYYKSTDKWVIRKHVEMFIAAGVDFLIFDTTNAVTYMPEVNEVCTALSIYKEDGWDVPEIAFYTNSYSIRTMNELYNDFYKQGLWEDLWYKPDGVHPMIIGAQTPEQDRKIVGDPSYFPDPLSEEFLNFFDLRDTQWPFDPFKENGYPWIEWTYPQPVHNGVINVAVAEHPDLPFSSSIKDRNRNWGRGYNFETHQNVEADMRKGTNFQSQWNTAINNPNVKTAFVTGWNEWIALKLIQHGEVSFVDCATEEFSRDIEPMKGGYEDAFYLQLCDNIRRFNGLRENFKPSDKATIDINGPLSQWDNIRNVYQAMSQAAIRQGRGDWSVDNKTLYKYGKVTNNIQRVKVTNDKENIYFLISCQRDIVKSADETFMNVFIGLNDLKLTGWEGYSFVIDGNGNISSLDKDGKRTEIGKAEVSISGKNAQFKIPMRTLGTDASQQGIYFKVADGVTDENSGFSHTEIMDYYQVGKSLPMGRLSYYYYFN